MALTPTPTPNPLVFRFADYTDLEIRITVNWDAATRATTGATVHRDDGCQWTKILVGTGADGSPDSTVKSFDLSGFAGDRSFTAGQMSGRGFATVDDFLSLQITAGR